MKNFQSLLSLLVLKYSTSYSRVNSFGTVGRFLAQMVNGLALSILIKLPFCAIME